MKNKLYQPLPTSSYPSRRIGSKGAESKSCPICFFDGDTGPLPRDNRQSVPPNIVKEILRPCEAVTYLAPRSTTFLLHATPQCSPPLPYCPYCSLSSFLIKVAISDLGYLGKSVCGTYICINIKQGNSGFLRRSKRRSGVIWWR